MLPSSDTPPSLLARSGANRLLFVFVLVALLWLAIGWAVMLP